MKKYFVALVAPVCTAALIAGCGGGGGGNSNDSQSFANSSTGRSAKGVISGGIVKAQEITATGLQERGTSEPTNADGTYSLNLNDYQGGPVLLTLRGQSSGTTMTCDLPAGCGDVTFGNPIALDGNFTMKSILPVAVGTAQNRPITALTHLAYCRATEVAGGDANITKSIADDAASEVANLFGGVDSLRTNPVDITDDSARENADAGAFIASALSAAVLGVGLAKGDSAPSVLQSLCNAFTGGKIAASDDNSTPGTLSLQDIVDSANSVVTGVGETDRSGTLAAMQQIINNTPPGGDIDPQPSNAQYPDQIATAKGLIAQVRNIANSILKLEEPADAFGTRHQMVGAIEDSFFGPTGEALTVAIGQSVNYYETQEGEAGNTTITTQDSSGNDVTATLTIENSDGNNSINLTGDVGDATVNIVINAPSDLDDSANTTLKGNITGNVEVTNTQGLGARLDLQSGVITARKKADAANGSELQYYDSFSLDTQAKLSQVGVDDPVSFTGAIKADLLRCTACERPEAFSPTAVEMSGTLADSQDSIAAMLKLSQAENSARNFNYFAENGQGDLPESRFPQASLTANLDVVFSGQPKYNVTLTTNVDGIGKQGDPNLDAVLRLTRNGENALIVESDFGEPLAFTITTSSGGQLILRDVDDSGAEGYGELLVDGRQVGTVEQTDDDIFIVRYNDGTFESLN